MKIGVKSQLVLLGKHGFDYGVHGESLMQKAIDKALEARVKNKNSVLYPLFTLYYVLVKFTLFFNALVTCNCFVFGSGSTFFESPIELFIYRLLNKKVIAVFVGSDARPAYLNLNHPNNINQDVSKSYRIVEKQKAKFLRLEKYGVIIINHVPTGVFCEKPFLKWLSIGFPRDVIVDEEKNKIKYSNSIRVFHSPSNPRIKGSEILSSLVGQVQKEESINVEFFVKSGVSNKEIISTIKNSDIILDQLYSDTPLAGLATEAALLGKPSVIFGYYSKDVELHHNKSDIPPSFYFSHDTIYEDLVGVLKDRARIKDIGLAAKLFVDSKWTIEQVASRYVQVFDNNVPDEWWFNPNKIDKLYPLCDLTDTLSFISEYIDTLGVSALMLNDKPKIIKWIKENVKEIN